jgi:formate dehydrogenase subunit gamma
MVEQAVDRFAGTPGPLLSILHAVQDDVGYIPPDAVQVIAHALNLSRAEVYGVISFYHDFSEEPRGRHHVRLCRAEACQSMGAEALVQHACTRLGVALHGTTADGAVTLDPVYCLGNCALSPAMLIDADLYGCVTPARFDALMDVALAPHGDAA